LHTACGSRVTLGASSLACALPRERTAQVRLERQPLCPEGQGRLRSYATTGALPHSTWWHWRRLQAQTPQLAPRERQAWSRDHDGRDSSGRSCGSGVASRAPNIPRSPKGARQRFSRQRDRIVSRIGGPHRLGEPLPPQLTTWAKTNLDIPLHIELLRYVAEGSTHRCQWLEPTRMSLLRVTQRLL